MKTHIEKELKVLHINKENIIKKLHTLDTIDKGASLTEIVMYDFVEVDSIVPYTGVLEIAYQFFQRHGPLKNNQAYLRLRKNKDHIEITFKCGTGGNKTYKTEKEYSEWYDLDQRDEVYGRLLDQGLIIVAYHEKIRHTFLLGNVIVDIDTWPGIPTYIEVEADTYSDIDHAIHILQLEAYETSALSGPEFFSQFGVDFYSELRFHAEDIYYNTTTKNNYSC